MGIVGIAGGKIQDDRSWSEAYHKGLDTVGEDMGGVEFHADPDVNKQGNICWKELARRPTIFREIANLDVPTIFINAGQDIRPNWPTQQLAELMPNARYVEIDGAAHSIWLTHADELRLEMRKAVNQVIRQSA